MKNIKSDIGCRLLSYRILFLIVLFFVILGIDDMRAEAQTVNKFIVSYFASYKESASNSPGATTAAMTAISFFNLSNMQCDVSVLWNFRGGGSCITNTTLNSIPPLQPNDSVIHCSREITTLSEAPNCSQICQAQDDATLEGFARVSIQTDCADHVGIDSKIYYTVFDVDMLHETILSLHKPEIYRLVPGMPSRIE